MAEASTRCDVLIVGAGPAGLMMAAWLARFDVSVRIIDRKSQKLIAGQADGLQCRTIEVFQSFGFADRVDKEATIVEEVTFWNPDHTGHLVRTGRVFDTAPGTSRFPHYVLHQGRIERFFLDNIEKYGGIQVERAMRPVSLDIDETSVRESSAYPLTVGVEHLTDEVATGTATNANGIERSNAFDLPDDPHSGSKPNGVFQPGTRETIQCKYLIGGDGSRSWVRHQLGFELEGDSANVYWGVVDTVPVTDFPDVRVKVAIHSASAGSILIVPREKQLVRFYIQMGTLEPGKRLDRGAITLEKVIATAQRILSPFTLQCPEVAWWTVYEIGQRVCANFSAHNRIFIAGDACHTHSPKAGQGMNVSMMDTYNLGWKIGCVLTGRCRPDILSTYQSERHQIAVELIEFDYKFSRLFSGKPAKDELDKAGISTEEFEKVFVQAGKWTSGTAVCYKPSLLIGQPTPSADSLASNVTVGMRFESVQVVTVSDAQPRHLGDRMISDGRWRILLFSGAATETQLQDIAAPLSRLIWRYTPPGDSDTVFDVLTVMTIPRRQIDYEAIPDILRPRKGRHGYRDHYKIFVDDESYHRGHGRAYETLGIDPQAGCIILCRPDQYVSLVTATDDVTALERFCEGIMLPVKR